MKTFTKMILTLNKKRNLILLELKINKERTQSKKQKLS